MDLYKNNKIAFSLFIAITIIAIGGVYAYISSTTWSQPKVAEAAERTTTTPLGSCKNTYTRHNNGCGIGCADYRDPITNQLIPGGDATQLWRSYNINKITTFTTKGAIDGYTFVSLDNVCSTGDKYNASNPTTLLAGTCSCSTGGAYAICCSGSTPVNATKLDPNNPYSDPYPPPEAGCGSYSKIISTPPTCPSVPTVTLTANPTPIKCSSGQSSTLTWSSTNATGCTGTNFGTSNKPNGTYSVSPASDTTYSIFCTGPGGTSATKNVKVACVVPPTITNGSCGPANGVPTTSAPSANLCSPGTPSTPSGTGPWTWTCAGSNGGTTASCSAPASTTPSKSLPPSVNIWIN